MVRTVTECRVCIEYILTIHSCVGGPIYWPSRTILNCEEGWARTYSGSSRYYAKQQKWVGYDELEPFVGKTREIFYSSNGEFCYAGTFVASGVTPCTMDEFRSFDRDVSLE